MSSKPSVNVLSALGALAFIAVALAPSVRGENADTPRVFGSSSADPSASAPTLLAQGRCYNGRCY